MVPFEAEYAVVRKMSDTVVAENADEQYWDLYRVRTAAEADESGI